MVYTFVNNIVHLNLNSIFNILNAITTKYRLLAYKYLILEIEPRDFLTIFLRFWRFEPHCLINFFLIKKNVHLINILELPFIYQFQNCPSSSQTDKRYRKLASLLPAYGTGKGSYNDCDPEARKGWCPLIYIYMYWLKCANLVSGCFVEELWQ